MTSKKFWASCRFIGIIVLAVVAAALIVEIIKLTA